MEPEYEEGFVESAVIYMLNRKSGLIDKIKNPTEKMQIVAMNGSRGRDIRLLENPSFEVVKAALRASNNDVELIRDLDFTIEERIEIISIVGSFEYLNNFPEKDKRVLMALVANYGKSIERIDPDYLDDDIRIEALKTYDGAWVFFKKYSDEVIARIMEVVSFETMLRAKINVKIEEATRLADAMFKRDHRLIRFIDHPTPKRQIMFFNKMIDGRSPGEVLNDIKYIFDFVRPEDMSLQMAKNLISLKADVLDQRIGDMNEEIQIYRVKQNFDVLKYIKKPSPELVDMALEINVNAMLKISIRYITEAHVEKYLHNLPSKTVALKAYSATPNVEHRMVLVLKYGIKPPTKSDMPKHLQEPKPPTKKKPYTPVWQKKEREKKLKEWIAALSDEDRLEYYRLRFG